MTATLECFIQRFVIVFSLDCPAPAWFAWSPGTRCRRIATSTHRATSIGDKEQVPNYNGSAGGPVSR
jgi:hypothetical protein